MPTRRRRKSPARPSYVVIGASAGGSSALTRIFRNLPADFPGAILIVLHVSKVVSSDWLVDRLGRAGTLRVKIAEHGEKIRQGTAYVAPPETHLLIRDRRVELGTGPREQYSRPAIDVLFRSAAAAFGRRTVGVILSGMLRDGTAGLRTVRDAGGITIVQDPETAEEPEMPRNAMHDLPVDYCLNVSEIGPVLDLLVRRAGSYKRGVLETGLASALRLMKDRARLLAKVYEQSGRNNRTRRFLDAEISALDNDIARIRRMIPSPPPMSAGNRTSADVHAGTRFRR